MLERRNQKHQKTNPGVKNYTKQSGDNSETKEITTLNDDYLRKVVTIATSLNHKRKELHKSSKCSETEKKISDFNIRYIVQFSKLSNDFEKWAAQRRLVIRRLIKACKAIDDLKSNSCKGRLFFSSADVIGTVGALVLNHFSLRWSTSILYTAASLGVCSVVCSLVEVMKTRTIIKDVIREYRKDAEIFRGVKRLFLRLNDFDACVQSLFPNGVDWRIIEVMQKGSMESAARKEFQEIIGSSNSSRDYIQICLAVLLSNGRKDPKLLEDENFLNTVNIFSRSSFAEKWWNRKKCQQLFSYSENPKVLFQLNSFLKGDAMPLHTIPLLSTPVLYMNSMPTSATLLLNSLIALDAFSKLNGDGSSKESEALRNFQSMLTTEYENLVDVYELLNPHYD